MINLQNIAKSFATKDLFSGINLRIDNGDRVGMIGGNGTGKTTIARIISGSESYDEGEILKTKNWKTGFLAQEVEKIENQPVHDFVESGRPVLVKARLEMEKYEKLVHENHDEATQMAYAEALTRFEEAGGYVVEAEVDRILAGLGFQAGDSSRDLNTLSGGWIMRTALAKLLFQQPDLLILDEPTNHLDLPALTWLEGFLLGWKGAFLVISHDRTFLNTMVNRIIELDDGKLSSYSGNYDFYIKEKEQRREIMEATLKNQEQRIAQVERFIEKNRAHKSKARQAGSRKKMLKLLEAQKVDLPKRTRLVRFKFPQPERSGTPVLKLENVHKAYGNTTVYKGLNFEVQRGEKVALIGPNGSGKSTLLKIAADVLPFEKGSRKLGHNVSFHYFAQHQLEALNPDLNPLQEMTQLPGWDKISWLRSLMGALLLGEKEIETKIADLSGGEKAKLALAKMLVNPANVILMDEPTNHLDPQARTVLESALMGFAGTLVFISHDRTFINTITTRVVEIVEGQLSDFIGNYDDYMRMKKREQNIPGGKPSTIVRNIALATSGPPSDKKKFSREEEKAQRKRQAQLRGEKRKATVELKKRLNTIEEKISISENKLIGIHKEYSRPDIPSERFADLGKESRALSQYLKTLYQDWEKAALELESLEKKFS